VILPFVSDDLLHHGTVQISYVLINILAQLGDKSLLVEHGHVDLEVFLPLRYVTQGAVEVFMKWQGLAHESLNVAVGHTLVEAAGWVCLSHELEEPSEGSGVRRLLGQEVIHSGLNRWEGLRDIHKDLILGLNEVELLEEEALGILISQNKVKQRHTIEDVIGHEIYHRLIKSNVMEASTRISATTPKRMRYLSHGHC
jgi:hypothetical protein